MRGHLKSSPVTPEVFQYIVDTFAKDDARLLARMERRAVRARMPLIMISEDQAPVLRLLVALGGVQRALDVGTLFGFSAAVLARAMGPSGRVVSLELDAAHARVARENLREERLGRRVRVVQGTALASMKKMPADSFDLVLIDADKGGYVRYLAEAVRLLRHGGIVAADNALAWGQVAQRRWAAQDGSRADVEAIRRFNRTLARRDDIVAALLPVGDGLAVGRVSKRRVTTA